MTTKNPNGKLVDENGRSFFVETPDIPSGTEWYEIEDEDGKKTIYKLHREDWLKK